MGLLQLQMLLSCKSFLPTGLPDRNEEEIKVFQRGLLLIMKQEAPADDVVVEEVSTSYRELLGEGEAQMVQENGADCRIQQPPDEDVLNPDDV